MSLPVFDASRVCCATRAGGLQTGHLRPARFQGMGDVSLSLGARGGGSWLYARWTTAWVWPPDSQPHDTLNSVSTGVGNWLLLV